MSYWAADDPLFSDGHYVEDWEIRRFNGLSPVVQSFVNSEAAQGNKIEAVLERVIFLSKPPVHGVLALPEGLCFLCPIQHEGTRVYDGDEEGVIMSLEHNERIYPTGLETGVDMPVSEQFRSGKGA